MRISDWSSDVCSSDLPSDVRKGDLRLRFLVKASRLAFAEAAQPSEHLAALLRCPAKQPDIETDNQDRRPETPQQQAEKAVSRQKRGRPNVDLAPDYLRLQAGIHEDRQAGGEIHDLQRLCR